MPSFLETQIAAFERKGPLYQQLLAVANACIPTSVPEAPKLTAIELQAQLELLNQNKLFKSSGTMRKLIQYLFETYLRPEGQESNQFGIGTEVFGKNPSTYTPNSDSAVRVKMSQLRRKLERYNETAKLPDDVLIMVPPNRYRLQFKSFSQFLAEKELSECDQSLPKRLFLAAIQLSDYFSCEEGEMIQASLSEEMATVMTPGMLQLFQQTIVRLKEKLSVPSDILISHS